MTAFARLIAMNEYLKKRHISEYLTVSPELITADNIKKYTE